MLSSDWPALFEFEMAPCVLVLFSHVGTTSPQDHRLWEDGQLGFPHMHVADVWPQV